jgi:NAD(P)-dependent dehydrogenase (short-subunit alcohol dehydrogenase family)
MAWLKGQVALVTGGTGGIGSAIVRRYVAEGARVAVMGRDAAQLAALAAELGDAVITVQGDVARYQDNQRAVAATLEAFGRLDTFVGNAAVFDYFTRLDRIAPQDFEGAFQKLFATNVQGYLLGAQASIEALRQTRGSMIFTLSNSAFYAGGGGILYVTAKHALVGMIRQRRGAGGDQHADEKPGWPEQPQRTAQPDPRVRGRCRAGCAPATDCRARGPHRALRAAGLARECRVDHRQHHPQRWRLGDSQRRPHAVAQGLSLDNQNKRDA